MKHLLLTLAGLLTYEPSQVGAFSWPLSAC
jgi:hypothetical protein